MDQLISHETAVLASEKGYNINCPYAYNEEGGIDSSVDFFGEDCFTIGDMVSAEANECKCYLAPTQTALSKWMREVHKIIVWVEPDYDFGEETILLNKWGAVVTKGLFSSTTETSYCETYEEALELGLQMGLNAIK